MRLVLKKMQMSSFIKSFCYCSNSIRKENVKIYSQIQEYIVSNTKT